MKLGGSGIAGNSHFSCIFVMNVAGNLNASVPTVCRELHRRDASRSIL